MTNPILERAARALLSRCYDVDLRGGDIPTWEKAEDYEREIAIETVRAVLHAIREPDNAMAQAADTCEYRTARPACYKDYWRAMVDELLKE